MFRNHEYLSGVFTILLSISSAYATEPEPAPAAVGQVISDTVAIDGISVPSGTALVIPTTLATTVQPASIHLIGGQMVELARNSSVRLEQASDGVQLFLQDGTLSFRDADDSVGTVAAPAELILAGGQLSVVRSPARGAVAVIMRPVPEKSLEFTVNDPARLKLDHPVLLWDQAKPLETSEVHCIQKVVNNKIQITEPVSSSFKEKSLLVQGPEVEKAIESGARVLGQTAPAILAGGCAAVAASAFPSTALTTSGLVVGTSAAGATSAVLLANPDDELEVASSPTPDPEKD